MIKRTLSVFLMTSICFISLAISSTIRSEGAQVGFWKLIGTSGKTVYEYEVPPYYVKEDFSVKNMATISSYLNQELRQQVQYQWSTFPKKIELKRSYHLAFLGKLLQKNQTGPITTAMQIKFTGAINKLYFVENFQKDPLTISFIPPVRNLDTKNQNHYLAIELSQQKGASLNNPKPFSYIYEWVSTKTIILTIGVPIMLVDGERKEIDPGIGTTPLLKAGRTILPIRAIVETMGGSIAWDGKKSKVTINARGSIIEMVINSTKMIVNGKQKITDVPPAIIKGRTMLPIRFVAENLNCMVDWDAKTQRVIITYQ